ncbi:hypothetical protein DVH24_011672 [Malus domestica]|uniref:Eukaryotic translation initiation factor 3 subunit E N-terminal domain-containing protein n=1 Tax=Malus domestica TaxID=3750 RepID=A0A498JWL4_MALDO|nr:hypothetical protein DVH24_011672 [Malus domestica]
MLLNKTNTVDYAMDIHKSLHHTEDVPQDMVNGRVEVVARLKALPSLSTPPLAQGLVALKEVIEKVLAEPIRLHFVVANIGTGFSSNLLHRIAGIFDSGAGGCGCGRCIGQRVVGGGEEWDRGTDRLERDGSYVFRLNQTQAYASNHAFTKQAPKRPSLRFTPPSSLLFINRAQPCKSDAKPPDLGVDTLTVWTPIAASSFALAAAFDAKDINEENLQDLNCCHLSDVPDVHFSHTLTATAAL